jgi:ABC-2 type transport system ATP-binding protein
MTSVTVADVHKRYGSVLALDGVDFQLTEGITGLLGPNGAGKTTLLRCLATVLAPDAGDINVLGFDPDKSSERTEVRRRLGYMPQEPGFYQSFTCFDFLDYLAILKEHVEASSRHEVVRAALARTGLEEKSNVKIKKLSGGMRRRLALAQALIGSPPFLVLDEPTAGLDPEQRFRFRELISDLSESRTVLLSTHQTEDVSAICDRVLVMDQGRVLFDGSPRHLANVATGKVWLADERPTGAHIYWRTAEGSYRGVGEPPESSSPLEPTIEDGYLLLVGAAGLDEEAA